MQKINIDNEEYDLEKLPDAVRAQLFHIQATDVEINRMNTLIAVMQTARTAYVNALKSDLKKLDA